MMNTDESLMVASNGNIYVVGSVDTLNNEKITDDNCDSILQLRAGSSAGADGPRIYMIKRVKVDLETLRGDFLKKHNGPPGSGVFATPNGYLIDKTW